MLETIKSYLVSLGFSVDKSSYQEANKAMDEAGNIVSAFAGKAVTRFAMAGAAVVTFAATAAIGIASFIGDLAKTDLEMDKLSRQLWTSKENAAAFNNTLQAMGATLQDLYLSPELMRNFQLLNQQARTMRPPAEYYEQMKFVRSIQLEFVRLKLEATYALQWIGYYLIKYMAGPIKEIKDGLHAMNNAISKDMPHWTKYIGQGLSWILRLGLTVFRSFKEIFHMFDDIGRKIPNNIKMVGLAVLALGGIVASGPVGMLIAGFTTLLLLLDDFYTYLDGGDSLFGSHWKKIQDGIQGMTGGVDGFFKSFDNTKILTDLQQTAVNVFETIKGVIGQATVESHNFFEELKKSGVLDDLAKRSWGATNSLTGLLEAITDLYRKIMDTELVKRAFHEMIGFMKFQIMAILRTIGALMTELGNAADAVGKLMKGDMKGAGESMGKFFGQGYKDLVDIFKKGGQDFINIFPRDSKGNFIPWGQYNGTNAAPQTGQPMSYIYPQSNQSNTSNNTKVELNQTNNIYGSDSQATAGAVVDNTESMLLHRNLRGPYG